MSLRFSFTLVLAVATRLGGQSKELCIVVIRKLRNDGVSGVLLRCIKKSRECYAARTTDPSTGAFDHEFGTDTGGIVPLWKLRIQSPHRQEGVWYEASDPAVVRSAIASLPIEYEEFAFVDLGSGKGRTLLIASEHPFRRVIGVEFASELNAVATANIMKYQSPKRKCEAVSSICADAATFELPEESTVFFLFNPFGEQVISKFLFNLKTSLGTNKRQIYIFYYNAVFGRLFDEADFLHCVEIAIHSSMPLGVWTSDPALASR